MAAKPEVFRQAAMRALDGLIDAQASAGGHLAWSHRTAFGFLADVHRGLAHERAHEANWWRQFYDAYGAAEEATRARLEEAEHEARELAAAARFHRVLDAQDAAAAASAEDHAAWERDRLMDTAA